MLIILGGLPGVGKTSIAKVLAKKLRATYIRIDSIEQSIRNSMLNVKDVIDSGYRVGYLLAKDNLVVGNIVIADSVNSIEITRSDWRRVAVDADSKFMEIEIICSNKAEHQNRIKVRKPDIKGHVLPDWQKVEARDYENWRGISLVLDTAVKTINECVDEIVELL